MATTRELVLRFSGDARQLRQVMGALRTELGQFGQGQVAVAQNVTRQTQQSEQRRVADTIRSANQRLREEQRAAREVARIMAETARQAERQERVRERAAKQLADVQVREAKRAAKELEASLGSGRGGGSGVGSLVGSIAGRIPGVGNLASEFSSVSAAATGAGGAIAAVAGPIALAVTAAGGLAAGLAFLAKKFFDLTVATAEFQGKFRDLSQQVGVSSETLSTLDFFAETTGGNIETVSASLAIFQKGLEAAHDPTSKESKLLKELGVTSLDTETALRQTVAGLFRLGEGSKQTTAALELFGRSGRFLNAIVKESEGNFDKAARSAANFGRLVTTQAAIAADRFNDSLIILRGQIAGVTRSLTQDAIPVFIAFFEQISGGLAKNSKDWQGWGAEIARIVAFTLAGLKTLAQFAASGLTIPLLSFNEILFQNFSELLKQTEQVRGQIETQANLEAIQRITAAALAGKPGDRPDAKKAASEAQARANKLIQIQQQALEESTRANRVQLERERDLDLKNIDDWETESIAIVNSHNTKQSKIFDQELANAKRFIKDKAELLLAEIAIQAKRTKLNNETLEAFQKIDDEAKKRRADAELKLNRELLAIRDAQREAELQRIKAQQERLEITESAGLQRQIVLLKQAFDDREVLRNLEVEQATTTASRLQTLTNERIADETRLTSEVKRLTEERIRALVTEGAAKTPAPGGTLPEVNPNIVVDPSVLGVPPEAEKSFRGLQAAIDAVGESLGNLVGASADFARDFGDVIGGVVDAIAFGIGDLVNQWVLLGTTGPAAMRKLTASVLAGLAAQAAVKAIFQLAEGFAALFFNPAEAVAHFKSAALFASIAGIAAVAGRGIAGDLFQSKSGAGDRGGASSGPGQLNPLTLNRAQPQPQVIRVENLVRVESNDSHILKVIRKNHNEGGVIREMSFQDGVI